MTPAPSGTPAAVIRPATVADAAGIAAVHTRAWQQAYRGLLPQEFLDGIDPDRRRTGWEDLLRVVGWPSTGTLVAAGTSVAAPDRSGGILGFASVCPSRDDDGTDVGELASLCVDPPAWRRGVGSLLHDAAVTALARAGFAEATLWVPDGNESARRFCARVGWSPDGAVRQDRLGDVGIAEVRYRRRLPVLPG